VGAHYFVISLITVDRITVRPVLNSVVLPSGIDCTRWSSQIQYQHQKMSDVTSDEQPFDTAFGRGHNRGQTFEWGRACLPSLEPYLFLCLNMMSLTCCYIINSGRFLTLLIILYWFCITSSRKMHAPV